MPHAILKVNCKDLSGIIFKTTEYIYNNGGNIVSLQQHKEDNDNHFFMRLEFDLAKLTCTRKELDNGFNQIADEYEMSYGLSFSDQKKRVAIMVSKYDHCLYDLLLRHQYGELDADIALIVSNHPDLEHVAFNFKTPFFYVPIKKDDKKAAEEKMLELYRQHQVDLIVLARYMQIVTPVLLTPYHHRIINVHHGFLPAFIGAKPYHQAYQKGVKIVGATAHYATEVLDMGPIIDQETVRVEQHNNVADYITKGRDAEKTVLARAVKAHLDEKIVIYKDRSIIFD